MVFLSWTTPGGGPVTGYTVQAGNAPGSAGFFNGPVGLANGVSAPVSDGTYYIRVIAAAACGASAPSNEIAIEVPAVRPEELGKTLVGNG
jgi:hypothetical protein